MSASQPVSNEQIVTLLAIDMVDFSVLSERMPPEQTFTFLRTQLDIITKVVGVFDGTVDHFYGDGVLCFFTGDVDSTEELSSQTDRALLCADKLQKTFVERALANEDDDVKKKGFLPLKIGINTAQMYVGTIPSLGSKPILVGPGLNYSRRLAGNCESCKIMLGSSSLDYLRKVDRIQSPIKRRYVQMHSHGEVVMAYEYNPFQQNPEKLAEIMRRHMHSVGVERREERWPSPNGVLTLELDTGNVDVRNFSLRGFAFDTSRYLAPGINLAAKILPKDKTLLEDLRDLDLCSVTLEVRWGYPVNDQTFRHGVQIKNFSTTQCLQLNNLLRRTIHNKSA